MRGRMSSAASYAQPVAVGDTMEGEAIADVLESRSPDFRPGDIVRAMVGWRSHAVINATDARQVPSGVIPVTAYLGVLGMPGFTAYAGMRVIGQPKPGETVVVSAATGPVGSLVGQLAKRAGARAVGIAGGAAKCHYLVSDLGFDAAVDRHTRISRMCFKIWPLMASMCTSKPPEEPFGRRYCRYSIGTHVFQSVA